VSAAKEARKPAGEIEWLQPWHSPDVQILDDEINALASSHLCRVAYDLDVALPDWEDHGAWEDSSVTGRRYLTTEGRRTVRAAIRAEQKERYEAIRTWAPTIAAIVAALAAWVAALRK
jgi:hypothetical protein